MAPSQTLKWVESGKNPSEQNVEIEGTEPYIVGGHTASGYWVDTKRETTIRGLFAAGDVAGGCPQKYVTGALVEGEIAALRMVEQLDAEEAHKVVTGSVEDAHTDTANGTDIAEIKKDTEVAWNHEVAQSVQSLNDKVAEYDAILQKENAVFTV